MDVDGAIDEVLEAEEAEEAAEAGEAAEPPEADAAQQEEEVSEEEAVAEAGRPDPDPDELDVPDASVRDVLDLVRIGDILGVPLWWEHTNPGPRNFPVARKFVPTLEATLRVLERAPSAFGALKRINSAGLWVDKAKMHGLGRACDWDRLIFARLEIAPRAGDHASTSLAKRQRYWAFAAICRSNSAYVLHGEHDANHTNHVHQDSGGEVRFRTDMSSTVKLCQAVLNDIFAWSPRLSIDGDYGTKTKAALRDALTTLQLSGDVTDVAVWRKFLRRSGRLGFELSVE